MEKFGSGIRDKHPGSATLAGKFGLTIVRFEWPEPERDMIG
jgi:hypothetical protein